MFLPISLFTIFIVSLALAIKSSRKELSVPHEIAHLKIKRKKKLSGVILFLKEKIIHYSSGESPD